jgi:hypothetical protein
MEVYDRIGNIDRQTTSGTANRESGDSVPLEIAKKDVLREMGITYGQFYRWKRMALIPESWFIRRSTFTGQETFLPREKVLERIRRIQELKDRYSLEEIAEMLSPDATQRGYKRAEVVAIPWVNEEVLSYLPATGSARSEFRFQDLVCLRMIGLLQKQPGLSQVHISHATQLLLAKYGTFEGNAGERWLSLVDCGGHCLAVIHTGECVVDNEARIVVTVDLGRLAEEVKLYFQSGNG